ARARGRAGRAGRRSTSDGPDVPIVWRAIPYACLLAWRGTPLAAPSNKVVARLNCARKPRSYPARKTAARRRRGLPASGRSAPAPTAGRGGGRAVQAALERKLTRRRHSAFFSTRHHSAAKSDNVLSATARSVETGTSRTG